MAVVPICYKMYYKHQTLSPPKEIRQNDGCFMFCIANPQVSGCVSSISKDTSRSQHVLYYTTDSLLKVNNTRKGIDVSRRIIQKENFIPFHIFIEASVISRVPKATSHLRSSFDNASKREKLCTIWHALKSSSSKKQLRSLDSYFGKLQNDANQPSSTSLNYRTELHDRSSQSKAKRGLAFLEDYFCKVNEDAKPKNYVSSAFDDEATEAALYSDEGGSGSGMEKLKIYKELKDKDSEDGSKSSYDETSSLYLISILASINIAVFLFEIASPIRNSDLELFSLPLLYGGKINHLIQIGEWWRLVTPMFLHSGILHVTLGCWVLLTFGPQVCRTYGSFTFFLIYILGGLCGNLTSFLHTPDLTVGGTGPGFALIGAWLIHQIQNRELIGKDDTESMFQKAIIATAFSCILSNFGPIDDWTHFGAVFSGIAYGFLTCPTLQMDDASSKTGQEEGIALVRRYADPCKSLALFSLFILVLSSLLFVIEPPLNSLDADDFL